MGLGEADTRAPAYEYDMGQGMDDGYLAACEIVQRDIFLDDKTESERVTGVERADLAGKRLVDARTGEPVAREDVPRPRYDGREETAGAVEIVNGRPRRRARGRVDEVHVSPAGRYIVTMVDGQARLVTIEEYKRRLAERLVAEAPTLEAFRARWIVQADRRELLGRLPDAGRSPLLVSAVEEMADYDLYDVLAELGYGLAPRTRPDRADAFGYKHRPWLAGLPADTAATLQALTAQFARAGTDGLESREVFRTPEVARAGGLAALKALGRPAEILRETKSRLFAA